MAYIIRYTCSGTVEREDPYTPGKRKKLLITVFLAALIVLGTVMLLSDSNIQQLLIPGDPQITKEAFMEMTQSVRSGQPVDEAIIAFCRQIISYAEA